jgi:hypothetical protein
MKTIRTLADLNREDGITTFTEELGDHPGRDLFLKFIKGYTDLDDMSKAQHKLANSQTYIDYCDAQKYGIHIYNYRSNGGLNPILP